MDASKNKLDSAQNETDWTKLIEESLKKVDKKPDSFSKMQALYDEWRVAQAEEHKKWGSIWKYSKRMQNKYQSKLDDDGSGYIPISQFEEWEAAFLADNDNLRKTILEICIPSYIVPSSEGKEEKEIWSEYHNRKQRLLIISREAGLYGSVPAEPILDIFPTLKGRKEILYGAIYEAFAVGALRLSDEESVEELIKDQVKSLIDGLNASLKIFGTDKRLADASPNNAWLRKVSGKVNGIREKGETAARAILMTAYIMNDELGPEEDNMDTDQKIDREGRALKALKNLYPKTLKDDRFKKTLDGKPLTYDAAYDFLKNENAIQIDREAKGDATKNRFNDWAKSLNNIAYLTVNKRGGASDPKKSKGKDVFDGYIKRYGDFFLKEIALYNPTEVIVYGLEIWDWLSKHKEKLVEFWHRDLEAEKKEAHPVCIYGLPHWAQLSYKNEESDIIKTTSYLYRINELIRPSHSFELKSEELKSGNIEEAEEE